MPAAARMAAPSWAPKLAPEAWRQRRGAGGAHGEQQGLVLSVLAWSAARPCDAGGHGRQQEVVTGVPMATCRAL